MAFRSWTNQHDITRLSDLRLGTPLDLDAAERSSRMNRRLMHVVEPNHRLGVRIADAAMAAPRQASVAHLARMVPQLGTVHLPKGQDERPGLLARLDGGREREARRRSIDDRWNAIAQVTAEQTGLWMQGRSAHGLDNHLENAVRHRTVDGLAATFVDDGRSIEARLSAAGDHLSRRTALYLSMGRDVEQAVTAAAIAKGAETGKGGEQEAKRIRTQMAAARVGAIPPARIVELAGAPELATLDTLPRIERPMARPPHGRAWKDRAAMERDVQAAMSRPDAPVPAQWANEARDVQQSRERAQGAEKPGPNMGVRAQVIGQMIDQRERG